MVLTGISSQKILARELCVCVLGVFWFFFFKFEKGYNRSWTCILLQARGEAFEKNLKVGSSRGEALHNSCFFRLQKIGSLLFFV